MGIIAETDNGDRLKGLENEVWDPLPQLPGDGEDEIMHEEDEEQHEQHTPPHSPQQHHSPQYQHWPPGIPSYPEFYG